MTLAETYRDRYNAHQRIRLTVCLVVAAALHLGALGAGLSLSQQIQSISGKPKAAKPSPVSVEFVYLDPKTADPVQQPNSVDRLAQVNSVAGGQQNPNLPVNPGKQELIRPAPSAVPARPVPVSPLPRSASVPLRSPSRPRLVPSTSPLQPRSITPLQPVQPSPSPAPNSPPINAQANPQINAQANSPSSAQSRVQNRAQSLTAQIGRGLSGSFNPNRSAPGETGLDAMKDELWGGYISGLNQKIDRNWQRISVRNTRQTRVRFTVDRQGQLVNLQLTQSSGDARADMTALQSIRAAAPFAPLPREATEAMLVINFTFTYHVAAASPAAETAGSQ